MKACPQLPSDTLRTVLVFAVKIRPWVLNVAIWLLDALVIETDLSNRWPAVGFLEAF